MSDTLVIKAVVFKCNSTALRHRTVKMLYNSAAVFLNVFN